jgi:predicted AlkP superfamily phosphohydrolase/phosphomutase
MVPKELRAAVSRHLLPRFVNEKLSMHWKTADIDWAATPIFLIENANEGFVRINLQGREPLGIVSTSEYDRICEELLDIARNMTNPDTGKLAASHVHKTRDVFSGPCCAQMPDVIVNWDPEARTTNKLLTEPYGVISSSEPACNVMPYYSGNHRPNAFLAAAGPDFANGQWSDQSSILDIAPTILQHFGITPPANINGRALNLP